MRDPVRLIFSSFLSWNPHLRSFGFDTAVTEAQRAIRTAKVEASGAPNGIGIVKVMGRYAGEEGTAIGGTQVRRIGQLLGRSRLARRCTLTATLPPISPL